MSRNPLWALVLPLVLMIGGAARGDLLSYEPFGYSAVGADLQGSSGAGSFGFAGPWVAGGFNASIHNNYDIAAGSLSFGQLLTSGNRAMSGPVNAIAGLTRDLAAPIGTAGTTRYYSLLLRPEGVVGGGAFNGFFGLNLELAGEPELFVGKPGGGAINQYVIEDRGGGGQHPSPIPVISGQTALLVVKAEFMANLDRFTLYVNPVPGGPEPAVGTIKFDSNLGTVNGFTLYSTGAFSVDELRLGQTFVDVTPVVPEPGVVGMLSVVALAVGRRNGFRLR
jgi:hypothetical protein